MTSPDAPTPAGGPVSRNAATSAAHPPQGAVREVVGRALAEDLTPLGDLTAALLPPAALVDATIASRAPGRRRGLPLRRRDLRPGRCVDQVTWSVDDGDPVAPGHRLAEVHGPLRHPVDRRAHRAEPPRPPVGRRDRDPTRGRRHRGHRRRPAAPVGHPQDHAGSAQPREGRGASRRRPEPPGQPERLGDAQGQPPGGAGHRGRGRCGPRPLAGPDWCTWSATGSTSSWPRSTPAPTPSCWTTWHPTRCGGASPRSIAAHRRERDERAWSRSPVASPSTPIAAYAGCGADRVSTGSITNSAPVLDIGLDITTDLTTTRPGGLER